jgi:hypothetical protein
MVKTISSILMNPTDKFRIQLSVGLTSNDNKSCFNIFSNPNGASYASINPIISVVLRYQEEGKKWERTNQISVNQNNICWLRLGMTDFYKKFQREDLFIYDDLNYIKELNSTTQDMELINLGKGQILKFEPAIIYDNNDKPLPGVMLKINVDANAVDLSIDEFESMMDLFERINVREEGLILLQTYLTMQQIKLEPSNGTQQKPTPQKPGFNIFERKVEEKNKEFAKSPVNNNIDIQGLDDLERLTEKG